MKSKPLPSLNALRAFEASARHLSFSMAAKELNVTPAAIGHQVKSLEHNLDKQLFVRLNREIQLTAAGDALMPGLRDVFTQLTEVMTNFRKADISRVLTISTSISVTMKWLIPRLSRFKKLHPDIQVRIDSSDDLTDFNQDEVDIAIRYGSGNYPGLRVVSLSKRAHMFPVCSPSLLEGQHQLNGPEDLVNFPLIDQPLASNSTMWPDWVLWLNLVGYPDVEIPDPEQFDSTLTTLQAAIEGQGIALVDELIAGDELESGKLIKPFDLAFTLPCTYYLVYPKFIADQYNVIAFTEWIQKELNDC